MTINWGDLVVDAELTEQVSAISEFEFELGQIEPTWFSIDGVSAFPVMARDGSGGIFVVTRSSPHVLYCTSEGAAGVIAHDLDGLLTLVVMCPYWHDVLHYSGMGKLHEMRRAAKPHGSKTMRTTRPRANCFWPSSDCRRHAT
jgi:hypothetical protein